MNKFQDDRIGWLPQMSYSNQELNKQKCVLVLNKSLCDIRKHFKQLIRFFEGFYRYERHEYFPPFIGRTQSKEQHEYFPPFIGRTQSNTSSTPVYREDSEHMFLFAPFRS